MKRWRLMAAAGLTIAGVLTGCASSGGLAAAARLRFLHFSPDTGHVQVRRNDVIMTPISNTGDGVLALGTASPEVVVNPELARYTATQLDGVQVFDTELRFDPSRVFLVLLGKRVPATDEPAFELRSVPYDDTLPGGTETGTLGTAGLRFFHAAVGAGTVSLVKPIADADPMVLVEDVGFGQISGVADGVSRPIEIPVEPEECRFEVRDGDGQVVAFATHTFAARSVLNLALINGAGRPDLLKF